MYLESGVLGLAVEMGFGRWMGEQGESGEGWEKQGLDWCQRNAAFSTYHPPGSLGEAYGPQPSATEHHQLPRAQQLEEE